METCTFVVLSPRLNVENLFVANQHVTASSDTCWKLAFSEDEKKHFWIGKVLAGGVEKVLSFPAVFLKCFNDGDLLKTVPKHMRLLNFEDIAQDFTFIEVGSTVVFTESEEYLGTFVLSEYFHIQELKRV